MRRRIGLLLLAALTSAMPVVAPRAATAATGGGAGRGPGWVAAENARAGTDSWRITSHDRAGFVEGFARATSTHPGEPVALAVSSGAPSYVVEAYRMGYYGGLQGRLLWTSPRQPGVRQSPPVVDRSTGLVEARWATTLLVPVAPDWPPGAYLLKLVSSTGDQSYVPLTVEDDTAHADVVVLSAVATWQAYNTWGGCSLYACPGVKGRSRAVKVSFDRPYAYTYNDGSADFLDHELPLVSLVEELGIDAAYATSVDLHERPSLARHAAAVLSLGHDEYYSRSMRQALVDARDSGVNLAFFGANAIYRHIRFEPAADGTPDRVEVNYRSRADPVRTTDPGDVTVEWRDQGRPEASIIGVHYVCAGVRGDFVVADSGHWVWAGAGLRDRQVLRDLVGNEADGVDPVASPRNLERLGRSPVRCGRRTVTATVGYYRAPSGAGVFATGTIWWVCALEARYCSVPANIAPLRVATANVLRRFAAGRAARPPSPLTPSTPRVGPW